MHDQQSTFPRIDAAVILGSGLGDAFDEDELEFVDRTLIEPHSDSAKLNVPGHSGRYALWRSRGLTALVALGRQHIYEGMNFDQVTGFVAVANSLGARNVIITNAAGGLNLHYRVGDIMLITGVNTLLLGKHMRQIHAAALSDKPEEATDRIKRQTSERYGLANDDRLVDRTPDIVGLDSSAISRRPAIVDDREAIVQCALERGLRLQRGVYAGVLGPSYETRAEVRMLRTTGADAVGMSTVAEWVSAARRNMRCVGFSLITNLLSDTRNQILDHADVVESGKVSAHSMRIAIECALQSWSLPNA